MRQSVNYSPSLHFTVLNCINEFMFNTCDDTSVCIAVIIGDANKIHVFLFQTLVLVEQPLLSFTASY